MVPKSKSKQQKGLAAMHLLSDVLTNLDIDRGERSHWAYRESYLILLSLLQAKAFNVFQACQKHFQGMKVKFCDPFFIENEYFMLYC